MERHHTNNQGALVLAPIATTTTKENGERAEAKQYVVALLSVCFPIHHRPCFYNINHHQIPPMISSLCCLLAFQSTIVHVFTCPLSIPQYIKSPRQTSGCLP